MKSKIDLPTAGGIRVVGIYGTAGVETISRAFSGVLQYMDEVGDLSVSDCRVADHHINEAAIAPPWRHRCDGVVVSMGKPEGMSDVETADWVISGGVPAVNIAADWSDPRIPSVIMDQQSLGELAATHLAHCGCRSFLFVGYAGSSGSRNRASVFRTAVTGLGFKAASYEIRYRMVGSVEDAEVIAREKRLASFLKNREAPVGVWALNDNFAAAVCLLCRSLGLAIPDAVKVLGAGDVAIARTLKPPLSSIRTPGEQVGYQAARLLDRLMQGRRASRKVVLVKGAEMIARGATTATDNEPRDVKDALAYIARHACAGVTVAEIADVLHFPRRSFERRFGEIVGHTAGEEINRVRLDRARSLLNEKNLSVKRIALMIGFATTAAFSKFFRKEQGVSPRAYRQHVPDSVSSK